MNKFKRYLQYITWHVKTLTCPSGLLGQGRGLYERRSERKGCWGWVAGCAPLWQSRCMWPHMLRIQSRRTEKQQKDCFCKIIQADISSTGQSDSVYNQHVRGRTAVFNLYKIFELAVKLKIHFCHLSGWKKVPDIKINIIYSFINGLHSGINDCPFLLFQRKCEMKQSSKIQRNKKCGQRQKGKDERVRRWDERCTLHAQRMVLEPSVNARHSCGLLSDCSK